MRKHKISPKFSTEVRERAVRMDTRMDTRAPRRVRLAIGGDRVDRCQDWPSHGRPGRTKI